MAFTLYDEDGYVGPVASIEGYGELMDVVRNGTYPALQQLLSTGMSRTPKLVASDLDRLVRLTPALDRSIKSTALNLKNLMTKEIGKEMVVITD